MSREVNNSHDVLDSRDVIKRIEELESEREALTDAATEAREAPPSDSKAASARNYIRQG